MINIIHLVTCFSLGIILQRTGRFPSTTRGGGGFCRGYEEKGNVMTWKNSSLPTRLNTIAAGILLAGLGSAVAIYLAAGDAADLGEYAPENTKMYRHDLELYGGKANLLASELMAWFDGLWHGKSLAYTVACIAVVVACGLFFVARHVSTGTDADDRDKEQ